MRSPCALVLSFVVLLCGCSVTPHDPFKPLRKGLAGYEGPIAPLTEPYLLRYQPGPEFVQSLTREVTAEGETNRATLRARGKLSLAGERRKLEGSISEIDFNGRTLRSEDVPILTLNGSMSDRGPLQEIDLDFPWFREEGVEIPERDSEDYRKWVGMLERVAFELPEDPVEMDTELVASRKMLALLLDDGELSKDWQERILDSVNKNTLSIRVAGETLYKDAHCIVAIADGTAEGQLGTASFVVEMLGHWLIASETGISMRYAIAVEALIRNEGSVERFSIFAEVETDQI